MAPTVITAGSGQDLGPGCTGHGKLSCQGGSSQVCFFPLVFAAAHDVLAAVVSLLATIAVGTYNVPTNCGFAVGARLLRSKVKLAILLCCTAAFAATLAYVTLFAPGALASVMRASLLVTTAGRVAPDPTLRIVKVADVPVNVPARGAT